MSYETVEERKVAVYLDFESIKQGFGEDLLKSILEESKKRGRVVKTKIYFHQDQYGEERDFLDDIMKLGFEPVVVTLAKDVKMAIDMLEDSYSDDIDIILLACNREALLPALMDIKNRKSLYIAKIGELPESIANIADELIEL